MLDLSLLSSLSGVTDGSAVLDGPGAVVGGDNAVSLADWCFHLALCLQLALAWFLLRPTRTHKCRGQRNACGEARMLRAFMMLLAFWCGGAGTRPMIRGAPT